MFAVILIVITLVVIYFYNGRNFKYWANRGVIYEEPVIFFGNNTKNFLMQQSRGQAMEDVYWKYNNEKVVGFFRSSTPELILRDPGIIKQVLISDFAHFYMRGLHPRGQPLEPLLKMLAFVEGDLWKVLRQKLTPAFTTGKLKAMYPLIIDCAEKLQRKALKEITNGPVDARDLMARFTIDFIGSCGFGIEIESLDDENNEFKKIGYEFFNPSFKDLVVALLKEMCPRLFQNLKYFGRLENRMFSIVKQLQQSRGYQPSGRNDFVDQLLDCKKQGAIEIDSIEIMRPDGTPERVTYEFDDILITAQIFLFFAAGYETSSNTTSYTLHQLAFNPEIQEKVHKEVDEVLGKHNNKLSYDAVKEMTYLEWSFKESMRLFPALGLITRECAQKYTFSDIDVTIDAGVRVVVPVRGLHMDPQYWDNPTEFRPERFHPDNFTAIQKSVYFPFGQGPRNCIGSGLGQIQSLAGLAAILSRFSVEPAPGSVRFPDVEPVIAEMVQAPKGGKLPLIFRERKFV